MTGSPIAVLHTALSTPLLTRLCEGVRLREGGSEGERKGVREGRVTHDCSSIL